ncbi:MAG: DUF58 domain-containing protein, partial [Muribaculaceae bacterium]|nr:DUF58 domain-containing protein [Muribaculaceae bacterium]
KRDSKLPDVGLIRVIYRETGADRWLDTSSARVRKAFDKAWYERQQKLSSTVGRCGVDLASVATDEDFVKALLALFRNRSGLRR